MSSSLSPGKPKRDQDAFEIDDEPELRRRQRVDPDEVAEYTEWVEERRHKGRKKRREDDRDRRRERDDGDGS